MEHKINWDKIILYVLATVAFIYLIGVIREFKPKTQILPTTFDTSKVEELVSKKDSLENVIKQLQNDFNSKTTERVNNINTQNNTLKNEITNIPNLRNAQRDSIWAILLSSKDSLPTRYWDLLEQRTRREGP